MSSKRLAAAGSVLAVIHRRWGSAALRLAIDGAVRPDLLPTGVAELDEALGGGLPRGRLIEISGWPTSGMRTLALRALAQAQAPAQLVAYVDVCGTFDAEHAAACGVNLAHVLVARPQSHREIFDMSRALIASGDAGAIVIDSLEDVLADRHGARLMSAALDRLAPLLPGSRCAVLLLREEYADRGDPLASSALAHAAAVRLLVERAGWVTDAQRLRGFQCRVVLRKHPRLATGPIATMIVPLAAR